MILMEEEDECLATIVFHAKLGSLSSHHFDVHLFSFLLCIGTLGKGLFLLNSSPRLSLGGENYGIHNASIGVCSQNCFWRMKMVLVKNLSVMKYDLDEGLHLFYILYLLYNLFRRATNIKDTLTKFFNWFLKLKPNRQWLLWILDISRSNCLECKIKSLDICDICLKLN